jgi:hypothetical protein
VIFSILPRGARTNLKVRLHEEGSSNSQETFEEFLKLRKVSIKGYAR